MEMQSLLFIWLQKKACGSDEFLLHVLTQFYVGVGRFYFYSSKILMGCISLTQSQMTLFLNVMPVSEGELKNSGKLQAKCLVILR